MKMTAEQKALFDALTPLQQEIAINTLSGMKPVDAYKASSGKAKSASAISASASEILSNPNVILFLDAMKAAAVSNAVMTRQEALERLSALASINLTDLLEFGTYELEEGRKQSYWTIKNSVLQDPAKLAAIAEVAAGRDGIKIKQHSPLAALKQLADMQGWNAPSKVDHLSSDGSMSPRGLNDFYAEQETDTQSGS